MQEQIGWLIELVSPSAVYIGIKCNRLAFTSSNADAIRFARKEDAERMALALELEDFPGWTKGQWHTTEHMWTGSTEKITNY